MKVKELTKILETLNPEMEILASSDSEGNCYKTIDTIFAEGGSYVIFPSDEIIEL